MIVGICVCVCLSVCPVMTACHSAALVTVVKVMHCIQCCLVKFVIFWLLSISGSSCAYDCIAKLKKIL